MNRYIIGSLWDRHNRNGANRNFEYLFEGRRKIDELNYRADSILSEAKKTNNMNQDVQKQINNLILSDGESDAEVIQARGDHDILRDRFENIESKYFDANDYGADVSANWQTNRNAFQAANDAAYSQGGGRVVAKPGTYEVKGIIQDSRVSFDLPGVTFKNPDGLAPNIISGRIHETTGNINKGSKTLTVDNIYGIEQGSIISVGRVDGMVDTQFTKLSSSINSTQTTGINIDVVTRFPKTGYMRVGDELIGYTGISGSTLTGVSRGALNTSSSSHSSGAFIGVARSLLAEVIDINGSTLTLNKPADISVSNTIVQTGVVLPGVNITKIDGNRITGGSSSSWYGLEYSFARWGSIGDLVVINGDMGAVILDRGTADFNVGNLNIRDTGIFDASPGARGSGLWIFRGGKRNRINSLTVSGKAWSGFYIDDRTATGSEWDSPCEYNTISTIYLELEYIVDGFKTGGLIVGSNYNRILNGTIIGKNPNGVTGQLGGGIEVSGGGQFVTGDGSEPQATGNEIGNINFDVSTPWRLLSPGNILHDCTYSENATAVPPVVEGNFVYASTNTPGGMPVTESKFTDGRQNDPSITFINDDDTGFYRYAEDTVGLSLGGTNKVTWYPAEMRLSDGYRVTTGTNLGTVFGLTPSQKIGFFGRTPKSQQPAIARNNGRDLGDVEDRLNLVIDTLRELGFIAPN